MRISSALAPAAIAEIDEAMNHYDVRAPYSTEIGRALGNKFSRNVACVSVLAARVLVSFGESAVPLVVEHTDRSNPVACMAAIHALGTISCCTSIHKAIGGIRTVLAKNTARAAGGGVSSRMARVE